MTIVTVMQPIERIIVVAPEERIACVAARLQLAERRLACVCQPEGVLVGIASLSDTRMGALSGNRDYGEWPIQSVMTARPVTCSPNDGTERVLDRMEKYDLRHLPVVDNGILVGLVSISELLHRARETARREVEFLTAFVFAS